MILQEPEATQADLRFRLFGVAVRVHPFFWLMSGFLGFNGLPQGPSFVPYMLVWIACVFVSILLHEMGHVFMGRLFGFRGHIVLYSFGGLAIGSNESSNPWKRIAVSFAGPLAQLVLFACLWGVLWHWSALPVEFSLFPPVEILPRSELAKHAVKSLWIINLFWALLNLLPIWPLDGGQMTRDFLTWLLPEQGVKVSLAISATVAGLAALNCLPRKFGGPRIPYLPSDDLYMCLFFAYFAFLSIQALMQEDQRRRWVDDHRVDYDDDRESWRG